MKRTIALAAASMIAVAGFAAPSFAEDATKPAAGTETQSGTTASPDTGTTASTTADADISTVIAAIGANQTSVTQIPTITEVSKLKVVKVGDIATEDADKEKLETALSENKEQVTALQTAVDANAALKAELEKQQVETSSVVAAKLEADGSMTVFVQ
jgi:hypothetical protein